MNNKLNKVKDWVVKHKKKIIFVTAFTVGAVGTVVIGNYIFNAIAAREKALLEIVENRLKLVKDGEFVDIVVRKFSDDFTETDVIRRWTKIDGKSLYLGKYKQVYDLSDEQIIAKQINKVYRRIALSFYILKLRRT